MSAPVCPRTGGTHTVDCPPRCRMPEATDVSSRAEAEAAFLVALARMKAAHDALLAEVSDDNWEAYAMACIETRRRFDELADVGFRAARERRVVG